MNNMECRGNHMYTLSGACISLVHKFENFLWALLVVKDTTLVLFSQKTWLRFCYMMQYISCITYIILLYIACIVTLFLDSCSIGSVSETIRIFTE